VLSLRVRLLLGIFLLVSTGLLGLGIATYVALDAFLVQRVDDQLRLADPFAGGQSGDRGPQHRPGPPGPGDGNLPAGSYAALVRSDGTVVREQSVTFGGPTTRPVLPRPLPDAGAGAATVVTTGAFRVLIRRIDNTDGVFLIVAEPLADVESTLAGLLRVEAVISSLVLLAVMLVALWIVRVGLRPLDRMRQVATEIAAGDLGRRVSPAVAHTEIGRLGLALNDMLSRIEHGFAEQKRTEDRLRRFVADASHELRTPLTSVRGYAELLRRRRSIPVAETELAQRRIEEEAIRMSGLVDDMLLLARLDQGRPLDRESVDLARIARDAVADARVVAPNRPITLTAPDELPVPGDEMRLRQVFANLVMNAVVHTPATSPIEVSLGREDAWARLTVSDHGPGLSEPERARVFEPFFRADPGRSRDRGGSGLGLSIVAAVVGAHSGRVEAVETPGGGATFRVALPAESVGQGPGAKET